MTGGAEARRYHAEASGMVSETIHLGVTQLTVLPVQRASQPRLLAIRMRWLVGKCNAIYKLTIVDYEMVVDPVPRSGRS